jgi:glutathione S-transferase
VLTIWGRLNSINVQKVLFCSEELGLAYKRIDAGREFGVNDTPDYLAMNPNGLVPVISDGGFILWESNAIVRYLCAKHGASTYMPSDLRLRAEADRWMDWQATTLNPAMHAAFHNLVRTAPDRRDAAAIEASRGRTEALMVMLNAHLSGRRFLTADTFTMAEFVIGPAVHRWFNMPVDRGTHPHILRWYQTLMERLSAKKVLSLPIT